MSNAFRQTSRYENKWKLRVGGGGVPGVQVARLGAELRDTAEERDEDDATSCDTVSQRPGGPKDPFLIHSDRFVPHTST